MSGTCAGIAHRDGVDHLAAGLLEAGLESFRRILAGREIGIGGGRRFALELVLRESAHRVAVVPHAERETNNVGRELRDPGGAGIGNDERHLGLRDDRRHRDRRRRVHDTKNKIDLVAGDQLGRRGLGVRAGRWPFVALDEFHFMRRDVLGMKLHVQVERLVLHIAKIGVGAGIRDENSDLDCLGLCRRRQDYGQHQAAQPRCGSHRISPEF